MQMAAIYTRVSSERQREAHTIASQTAALVEWATTLDLEGAHSRFPGHALTPTGVMAIRCKQFHLPDL